MSSYPVFFAVERPAKYDRAQLALRIVLLAILSIVGVSMGAIFGLLYLGLPVVAAIGLSRKGPQRFLAEEAPRIERGLRWVMSGYAYLMLLSDRLPEEGSTVRFAIEPGAWSSGGRAPSTSSALLRLIYSLPSAFVLGLLGFVSWIVWLVSALMILITEDYPAGLYAFQCGVLRWQARLFAYHASLVEAHPPYAFDAGGFMRSGDEPLAH